MAFSSCKKDIFLLLAVLLSCLALSMHVAHAMYFRSNFARLLRGLLRACCNFRCGILLPRLRQLLSYVCCFARLRLGCGLPQGRTTKRCLSSRCTACASVTACDSVQKRTCPQPALAPSSFLSASLAPLQLCRSLIRVLAHFCLGRISSLHGTFVACRLLATSVGSCIFGSSGVVDAS